MSILIDSLIKSLLTRYQLIIQDLSVREARVLSAAINRMIISHKFFNKLNKELQNIKELNYDNLGERLARVIFEPENYHQYQDGKIRKGTILGILIYSSIVIENENGEYEYYVIKGDNNREKAENYFPRIESLDFMSEYKNRLASAVGLKHTDKKHKDKMNRFEYYQITIEMH